MGIYKTRLPRPERASEYDGAAISATGIPSTQAATTYLDHVLNCIPLSLYPDYDRRPRNQTGSADLIIESMLAWFRRQALAG